MCVCECVCVCVCMCVCVCVAEHLINNLDCAVNFRVDSFSIKSKLLFSFHLKVLETIYILSGRSSLCKQRECLRGLNIISI